MTNLYTLTARREGQYPDLSPQEASAVIYHDIFDYPLSFSELIRWKVGEKYIIPNSKYKVVKKSGYFLIENREGLVYKRLLRKRISDKKFEAANKVARILSFLPSVNLVALTGSLAMGNSGEQSDIDFMVITKKGLLWTTRALAYLLIRLFGIPTRHPNDTVQKDRPCLNMWLDESDLEWPKKDRNLYTAHEIAQIVPLANKNKAYEKFLSQNKWILNFWPNCVKIDKLTYKMLHGKSTRGVIEKLSYWFQYQYMKSKITREVATPTRALFHPQDWGEIVLSRLRT